MKISFRKILIALAAAMPVLFFASCTSDLDPEVIAADGFIYSQDKFDSLVAAGVLDTNGIAIDTTKSAEKDSTSSDSKSSSSNEESSDSEAGSSSSAKEESSSSEDDDEEESSSSVEESSSSYEETFGEGGAGEAIIAKDEILNIGTIGMADVDEDDEEDLAAVKAAREDSNAKLPDGFSDFGLESTTDEFNYEAFYDKKFFCLTKDDSWLEISRVKLSQYINHFKNGADFGPIDGYKVTFADACKAVYTKKK